MIYKTIIYAACILLSIFATSGINFTNFFKKDKKYEAYTFVFMLSIAIGYLVGSFIIDFLEVSKII